MQSEEEDKHESGTREEPQKGQAGMDDARNKEVSVSCLFHYLVTERCG